MEFHMYTTKSIPLLMVVDQQKELKNIVYLHPVKPYQPYLWQSLYSLCPVASFGTMNR